MTELLEWSMIGAGQVNTALREEVAANSARYLLQPQPSYVVRRGEQVYEPDGRTPIPGARVEDMPRVDVAFMAPPTDKTGIAEIGYHRFYLGQRPKPTAVITCSKGASANFYTELQELSQDGLYLGDTATVGGGSGMLWTFEDFLNTGPDINEAYMTLNGTVAAIISSPKPTDEAALDAVNEGFAEPGHVTVEDMIAAEFDDFALKSAIAIDKLFSSGGQIDWETLRLALSTSQIRQALAERRRLMMGVYPAGSEGYGLKHGMFELIGDVDIWHNNWRIVNGLALPGINSVRRPLEQTTGPDVGFSVGLGVRNRDGVYSHTGPGAGPYPTSGMMLGDFVRIRPQLFEPESSRPARREFIRTTSVSFQSIETGESLDEKALGDDAFYALNNWRTGMMPAYTVTALNGSKNNLLIDDLMDKADELSAAGHTVRITFVGATVGEDELTIRHSDDKFFGATLWVIRDQQLYDRYWSGNQVEQWLGLYVRRDLLPSLKYDGNEAGMIEALRPYTNIFKHEYDAAVIKQRSERGSRPKVDDFPSVDEYVEWHLANPEPIRFTELLWDRQLGIDSTNNNLSLIFDGTSESSSSFDTETVRHFVALLKEADPEFVSAAGKVIAKLSKLSYYELALFRKGEDLLPEERQEKQAYTWIVGMYMTEAQKRLRAAGATDEQLAHLRN